MHTAIPRPCGERSLKAVRLRQRRTRQGTPDESCAQDTPCQRRRGGNLSQALLPDASARQRAAIRRDAVFATTICGFSSAAAVPDNADTDMMRRLAASLVLLSSLTSLAVGAQGPSEPRPPDGTWARLVGRVRTTTRDDDRQH
jgi:hypothetical protein